MLYISDYAKIRSEVNVPKVARKIKCLHAKFGKKLHKIDTAYSNNCYKLRLRSICNYLKESINSQMTKSILAQNPLTSICSQIRKRG